MKKLLRSFSVCLIVVAMLGTTAFAAQPDGQQSNSYIWKTTVSPVAFGGGMIEFDCSVTGTGRMDMIGIERIEIRTANGAFVESHYYADSGYEDMMGYDAFIHGAGVPFQGVPGVSYYAVVDFFAEKGNGGGGVRMESSVITAQQYGPAYT